MSSGDIFWHGTKCTCLEKRSVITQIMEFPKLSGSSTIKSITMFNMALLDQKVTDEAGLVSEKRILGGGMNLLV